MDWTQTVKKGHCNSPSADCKSKIGDMRGDFRAILLAKSLPYTNERPGGGRRQPTSESKCLHLPSVASAGLAPVMAERPVSECKASKKCLQHFFDTLPPALQEPGFFMLAK